MKRHGWFLIVLLMLGVAVVACDDDKDNDKNSGINDPSGNMDLADWPSDLPRFEYGELVGAQKDIETGGFASAIFMNVGNPQDAFDGYKAALSAQGWTLLVEHGNEDVLTASYEKGSASLFFSMDLKEALATILYSVS